MTTYAHYISETEVRYPTPAEFVGVPNWQTHGALLRMKGYLPVACDHEPPEGYETRWTRFAVVKKTKTVTTAVPVVVTDYETDENGVFRLDDNGERIEAGSHTEWREEQQEQDDSYIEVTEWEDIPLPEEPEPPAPVVRYSKYQIQLACQKRGIWEQVKAAIAAAGMQDSWANINDIASDNPELLAALPAIEAAFGAETVAQVLEEGVAE